MKKRSPYKSYPGTKNILTKKTIENISKGTALRKQRTINANDETAESIEIIFPMSHPELMAKLKELPEAKRRPFIQKFLNDAQWIAIHKK